MSATATAPRALPRYRQSDLAAYLRCPRRYRLERLDGVAQDHAVDLFAAPLGTAGHVGCELAVGRPQATRGEVEHEMLLAFSAAIADSQERGHRYDHEQIERATERLQTEYLDLVMALRDAVAPLPLRWLPGPERAGHGGIEQPFALEEGGRVYEGTVDAVAEVLAPCAVGVWGREPAWLERGELLVADWKFGVEIPTDSYSLSPCLQLTYYGVAMASRYPGRRVRTFLGAMRDLAPVLRPTDDAGEVIPRWLPDEWHPDYLAATASTAAQLDARPPKSLPKPRYPVGHENVGALIPRRREKRENPAYTAKAGKPRGPVFHEARIDYAVGVQTIHDTVAAIEAGLFPASGALHGACLRCPVRRACCHADYHQQAREGGEA